MVADCALLIEQLDANACRPRTAAAGGRPQSPRWAAEDGVGARGRRPSQRRHHLDLILIRYIRPDAFMLAAGQVASLSVAWS
jgi:hypothetical protein